MLLDQTPVHVHAFLLFLSCSLALVYISFGDHVVDACLDDTYLMGILHCSGRLPNNVPMHILVTLLNMSVSCYVLLLFLRRYFVYRSDRCRYAFQEYAIMLVRYLNRCRVNGLLFILDQDSSCRRVDSQRSNLHSSSRSSASRCTASSR